MRRTTVKSEDLHINMTPMIDVVFQLIIFFITTADMQNKALELKIRMAMAPHGKPVEQKDPRTIHVDVDTRGRVSIAQQLVPGPVLAASCARRSPSRGRRCRS